MHQRVPRREYTIRALPNQGVRRNVCRTIRFLYQLRSRTIVPVNTNSAVAQSEYGAILRSDDNQVGSVRCRETTIRSATLAAIEMTTMLSPISGNVSAIRVGDLLRERLRSDKGVSGFLSGSILTSLLNRLRLVFWIKTT